jgi:hypothetical protein
MKVLKRFLLSVALTVPCDSFSTCSLSNKQTSIDAIRRVGSSIKARSSPQIVEFEEPTTGVTVKLIGCMHYNPASIKTTKDTINALARENKLGSVIIESCDIRWNQTKALPLAVQNLLQSEMKAACELAGETYQRPVVLGDQRINITVGSLKRGFQETFVDLATPFNGGWGRLFRNITQAREEAVPLGDPAYLNPTAFLDPRLLLASPVSLVLYPLSYFFKSPIRTTFALTLLFLIDQPPSDAATIVTLDQMTNADWVQSLTVAGAEIVLFARVFLKDLLAERNVVLAKNILEECRRYQSKTGSGKTFWNSFSGKNLEKVNVMYVHGSKKSGAEQDKAVVAVLGMAHCNGIAKLLKEQKV